MARSFLQAWLSGLAAPALQLALAWTVLLALETWWPTTRVSWISRIRAFGFWSIYTLLSGSALMLFAAVWHRIGITPLVDLRVGSWFQAGPQPVRVAGWFLAPIFAIIVGEFFYYWFHRAQHAWHWLWRFHSVHHSLREMSALNCYHHVSEDILRIPFVTIPLAAFIFIDPSPVPTVVALVIGAQPVYEHSCTRWNWGWLRYVVADNRYHRLHHSVEARHLNRNFGSFTSIWDQAFGTAVFPARGEWPETGIPGIREPATLRAYLLPRIGRPG